MIQIKIWIFNHYASTPRVGNLLLRHYNFARRLIDRGHDVTIFAASAVHNSNENLIEDKEKYICRDGEGVPFVYIRTRQYTGNGKSRVLNMLDYYRGLLRVYKNFGKPDLIYASSVHPLSCVAGIKIARKLHIPCICEIRDLWPESIVAFNGTSPKNPVVLFLRVVEKWIYKNCDRLIFTMRGGIDYIRDQGWQNEIDLNKISFINNGVDLKRFDEHKQKYMPDDPDLNDESCFKVTYCGSIRIANNIENIVRCGEALLQRGRSDIKLIIYGDGEERPRLEAMCKERNIENVHFKGKVDKDRIPGILCKSDLNMLIYKKSDIWRYGGSQNKLFEYFASGKPIITNIRMGYDLIEEYNCGIIADAERADDFAQAVIRFFDLPQQEREQMGQNARRAAQAYDFDLLIDQLESVIQSIELEKREHES